MSDAIDDLHCAEDTMGELAAALRRFVELDDVGDFTDLVEATRPLLEQYDSYCRPSCCWLEDDEHCHSDDPDCCGCPCGHPERAGAEEWLFDPH